MKRLILILFIVLSGWSAASGQGFTKNISIEAADQLIRKTDSTASLVILDVRTPEEFRKGHIPGALNIDFWAKGFLDSIATHNLNKTYLIYCTSGVRSNSAMNKMRKLGFLKLYNLKGGIFGWKAARLPLIVPES